MNTKDEQAIRDLRKRMVAYQIRWGNQTMRLRGIANILKSLDAGGLTRQEAIDYIRNVIEQGEPDIGDVPGERPRSPRVGFVVDAPPCDICGGFCDPPCGPESSPT